MNSLFRNKQYNLVNININHNYGAMMQRPMRNTKSQ